MMINSTITDIDNISQPGVILIVLGTLKGYIKHPLLFLIGVFISMPSFIKEYKSQYPAQFLRSSALTSLMYLRLNKFIEKKKAFEIIRAVILTTGISVQQANFRNVEAERTFENIVKYQQRTNREGATKFNTMEIIEQSEKRYKFRITHCMFYDFFSKLDIPELTTLMCSIDNEIFNSYLPEQITFHRDGLNQRIADGCSCCTFVLENNGAQ